MLTLYLSCLVFGGVLLVASLATGDADVDTDVDLGLEADADADFDAEVDADLDGGYDAAGGVQSAGGGAGDGFNWLLFLKVRFYIFALTFFGLTGVACLVAGISKDRPQMTLPPAIVMGFLSGFTATLIIDKLKRRDSGRVASERTYIGMRGKVMLPLSHEKRGLVHLRVQGQGVDMPARAHDQSHYAVGDEVQVAAVDGAVLLVVRPREHATAATVL